MVSLLADSLSTAAPDPAKRLLGRDDGRDGGLGAPAGAAPLPVMPEPPKMGRMACCPDAGRNAAAVSCVRASGAGGRRGRGGGGSAEGSQHMHTPRSDTPTPRFHYKPRPPARRTPE